MPLKDVLPLQRVHLLGGVSDAGKTRFILPALLNWAGAPPWLYVAGDRTLEDAQDTMHNMGLNPAAIPTLPAFGRHNKSSWVAIMRAVEQLPAQPELLVIEGFQDLCPGQGRRTEVREFLSEVSAWLAPSPQHPSGLTVLGVVESPKLKPNERYPNPRQRISGPSGWGYHASTILLIEATPGDESFLKPNRLMWICCKGQLRRKVPGAFGPTNQLTFPLL